MRYDSRFSRENMVKDICRIKKQEEFIDYISKFCSDFYNVPKLKLKDGITPEYILAKGFLDTIAELDKGHKEKNLNQRTIAIKSGETEAYISKMFNVRQYIGTQKENPGMTTPKKKYRIARICMAMKLGIAESEEILLSSGYILNPRDPIDAAFLFAINAKFNYYELDRLIDQLIEVGVVTKKRKSSCMLSIAS